MGAENLAPTGIRSPDRPAHSESLYQLCYPSPSWKKCKEGKVYSHIWLTSEVLLLKLLYHCVLLMLTAGLSLSLTHTHTHTDHHWWYQIFIFITLMVLFVSEILINLCIGLYIYSFIKVVKYMCFQTKQNCSVQQNNTRLGLYLGHLQVRQYKMYIHNINENQRPLLTTTVIYNKYIG